MERELVRAVLANEALIALTGDDRPARIALLDRVEDMLRHNRCRIVRVASPSGEPLDLQRVMDRVVGFGQTGADRVERFFDAIALPVADEKHIVLMVDNADLLTTDFLSYLALIGPTTVGQDLRLQIVFAGPGAMWDRLPKAGNLSAERIAERFAMPTSPPPVPEPEPIPIEAISLRPPRLPPTEGHEILRQQLAEQERMRQRRQRVTGWVLPKVASVASIAVIVIATVVLWVRLPELRVVVRGIVAPASVEKNDDSQAVAALLARGNRLLGGCHRTRENLRPCLFGRDRCPRDHPRSRYRHSLVSTRHGARGSGSVRPPIPDAGPGGEVDLGDREPAAAQAQPNHGKGRRTDQHEREQVQRQPAQPVLQQPG